MHNTLGLQEVYLSSVDDLCKQFGPRSGPTNHQAKSGYKRFVTLMAFLKESFLEKSQQITKIMSNSPACKESTIFKDELITLVLHILC